MVNRAGPLWGVGLPVSKTLVLTLPPMITAQTPIDSDPVHQMLSTRALHVLMIGQAIPTVGDLAAVDRATAAKWRQCGSVTLAEFDRLLRSAGLWWGGQHSGDIEAVRARLKELEEANAVLRAMLAPNTLAAFDRYTQLVKEYAQ